MKYELETIPVWDAYHAEDECPLCLLQRKAERDFVRFYVGHSVMVPEMRVQVNDSGFCPAHFPMLLEGGNRLGLALITHTHVGELRRKLERRLGKGKAGAALKREIAGFDAFLSQQLDRCLICERLDDRFKRYSYTIVHLWRHENEFRQAFNVSRGICLDHVRGLLAMAVETLRAAHAARSSSVTCWRCSNTPGSGWNGSCSPSPASSTTAPRALPVPPPSSRSPRPSTSSPAPTCRASALLDGAAG